MIRMVRLGQASCAVAGDQATAATWTATAAKASEKERLFMIWLFREWLGAKASAQFSCLTASTWIRRRTSSATICTPHPIPQRER